MYRGRLPWYWRGFALGSLLLLVGCWQSCDYVRLRYFGEEAEARITEVILGPKGKKLDYVWKLEDGTTVRGSDSVGSDWRPPASQKVKIYYLPNSGAPKSQRKSQLAETSAVGPLAVLGVSVLLMVVFGLITFLKQRE